MNPFSQIKSFFGSKVSGFSFSSWVMSNDQLSKAQLIREYKRYIYTIVSAIAGDVAKLEFVVKQPLASGYRTIPNHPFLKLIRRPNPDYSQFSFLEMHQTYMELTGESFWYLIRGENTKKVKEIVILRPDVMEVAVDKTNNPQGYVTGYVMTKADGTKVPFSRVEILHFKTPNPNNPNRGLGPVEAAVDYVKTEEYASGWTKNSLFNSGRPSGIINIKGTIDKEEFEQIKKRFKQEYSGIGNAGKTMIIKGSDGVDYTKLGMELGEVALKDLKDMSRDDIMIMFRVSKTILGITDDVNRANAREAKTVWMENVIKPKMERIVDLLDSKMIDEWGDIFTDVELSYKDPAPKYLEDLMAEWDKGHNRWLTTNAIIRERNEFFGTDVDEVDGGDEIYQSVALVPMGKPLSPDPKEPKVQPKEPKKQPKKIIKIEKKELSRKEFGQVFRTQLFANQSQWQKRYQEAMQSILKIQENEILKRNKKTFEEWVFDASKSKALFLDLFARLGIELIRQQSLVAFQAAGDDQTTININERVLNFLSERVNAFATEFDQQTIEAIKTSIQEGVTNGESVTKLRNRIRGIYDEAANMRAERVARTETIAASNEAALESYRQSPMVVAQEWSTEDGACEFCRAFDGKVVGLESNFKSVGETITGADGGTYIVDYTNINHPPMHPNCMCSILPVAHAEFTKMKIVELEQQYGTLDQQTKEAKQILAQLEDQKREALKGLEIKTTEDKDTLVKEYQETVKTKKTKKQKLLAQLEQEREIERQKLYE